jgi:hypothetical protein
MADAEARSEPSPAAKRRSAWRRVQDGDVGSCMGVRE